MVPETPRTSSRPRAKAANLLLGVARLVAIGRRERLWIRRYYYLALAKETFNRRKKSAVKGSVAALHAHKKH